MLVCFSVLSNPNSFKIQAEKIKKDYFSMQSRIQAEHSFEIWVPNLEPGKILLLPHLWGWTPPQRAPVWELCGLRSWVSGTGMKSRNACEKQRTCFNFKLLPSQLLSAFITHGGGERETLQLGKKWMRFTGLNPFLFHPGQAILMRKLLQNPNNSSETFLLAAPNLSF